MKKLEQIKSNFIIKMQKFNKNLTKIESGFLLAQKFSGQVFKENHQEV
jgi:hypothetical protein